MLVHAVEGGPGYDVVGAGKAKLAGDSARRRGMVAGDHLDGDAGGLALAHRRPSLHARWIDQAEKPEHRQILHIGDGQGAWRG